MVALETDRRVDRAEQLLQIAVAFRVQENNPHIRLINRVSSPGIPQETGKAFHGIQDLRPVTERVVIVFRVALFQSLNISICPMNPGPENKAEENDEKIPNEMHLDERNGK